MAARGDGVARVREGVTGVEEAGWGVAGPTMGDPTGGEEELGTKEGAGTIREGVMGDRVGGWRSKEGAGGSIHGG